MESASNLKPYTCIYLLCKKRHQRLKSALNTPSDGQWLVDPSLQRARTQSFHEAPVVDSAQKSSVWTAPLGGLCSSTCLFGTRTESSIYSPCQGKITITHHHPKQNLGDCPARRLPVFSWQRLPRWMPPRNRRRWLDRSRPIC